MPRDARRSGAPAASTAAGHHPPPPPARQVARIIDESDSSLLDVLDNLLNRGVVLNADLILALADVDLVYVRLSALLCAADRVLPDETRGSEGVYVYALTEPGLPRSSRSSGRRLHASRSTTSPRSSSGESRPSSRPMPSASTRHHHQADVAGCPSFCQPVSARLTDERSLRALVSRHRLEILAAFEQARGYAQMTVRIFGPATDAPTDQAVLPDTGTGFLERAENAEARSTGGRNRAARRCHP